VWDGCGNGNYNEVFYLTGTIRSMGQCMDMFGGVPVTAYRMEASTLLLEAGVNIPLGGNQAFDFGASWFNSKADQGGGKYDGATFRLGYLYRFR